MGKELEIYNPDEPDEPSLSAAEEEAFQKNKFDKADDELMELFAKVKNVKEAIENPEFYDIFIKPIKGNIDSLKEKLETEEKAREIAVKQGALYAFRKMLGFPETAVNAFNEKLESLKSTMPLFIADNDFARNVSVSF